MPKLDPRPFHVISVADKVALVLYKSLSKYFGVPQLISFCQRSMLAGPSITDAVQSYQLSVIKQHT